jgi:hypothetical protein
LSGLWETCERVPPVDVGYAGTAEIIGQAVPIAFGIDCTFAAVKVAGLTLGTGGDNREAHTASEFTPTNGCVGFGIERASTAVQVAILCDTASFLWKGQSQDISQVM